MNNPINATVLGTQRTLLSHDFHAFAMGEKHSLPLTLLRRVCGRKTAAKTKIY